MSKIDRLAVEVLAHECELDRVLPLTVAQVRLALDALADPARALGVGDRPLVEPVARELEPVVADLEQEVALDSRAASSATRRPRNDGCTASAPRWAIRFTSEVCR